MNYSGNQKIYFEIYYSEKSAGTSNKYESFYKNLSDNNLESATKSTFQKLDYGLKNEDSDISNMKYMKYQSMFERRRAGFKDNAETKSSIKKRMEILSKLII